jgi:hypothetical protein
MVTYKAFLLDKPVLSVINDGGLMSFRNGVQVITESEIPVCRQGRSSSHSQKMDESSCLYGPT